MKKIIFILVLMILLSSIGSAYIYMDSPVAAQSYTFNSPFVVNFTITPRYDCEYWLYSVERGGNIYCADHRTEDMNYVVHCPVELFNNFNNQIKIFEQCANGDEYLCAEFTGEGQYQSCLNLQSVSSNYKSFFVYMGTTTTTTTTTTSTTTTTNGLSVNVSCYNIPSYGDILCEANTSQNVILNFTVTWSNMTPITVPVALSSFIDYFGLGSDLGVELTCGEQYCLYSNSYLNCSSGCLDVQMGSLFFPTLNCVYYDCPITTSTTTTSTSTSSTTSTTIPVNGVYCFQESANVSNQTGYDGNCGQNYSGSYWFSDIETWALGSGNASIDGDWSTYASVNVSAPRVAFVYSNWMIPVNASSSSMYNESFGAAAEYGNLSGRSIPLDCWNSAKNGNNTLMFRRASYQSAVGPYGDSVECFNGSNYVLMNNLSTDDSLWTRLYEDAIDWYIVPMATTTTSTTTTSSSSTTSTTVPVYYCYQESANVSNQTGIDDFCGLSYNGSYTLLDWNSNVSYPDLFLDGNWASFRMVYYNNSDLPQIYVNYSRPNSSQVISSIYKIKGRDPYSNRSNMSTVPSECFKDPIEIWGEGTQFVMGDEVDTGIVFFCKNISGSWVPMLASDGTALGYGTLNSLYYYLYDEAMIWVINNTRRGELEGCDLTLFDSDGDCRISSGERDAAQVGYYDAYINLNCMVEYNNYFSNSSIILGCNQTLEIDFDSCYNGIKDGSESDVDCGGLCIYSLCVLGNSCDTHGDCDSGYCRGLIFGVQSGVCAVANGSAGECSVDSDCASNYCWGGVCYGASCVDLVKNGTETGIDCGGTCPPCGCLYISQCAQNGSETCEDNRCTLSICSSSCTSVYWEGPGISPYTRDRYCINGFCSFSPAANGSNTSSGDASFSVDVIPYSTYHFNNSGGYVYVSDCESATNGFTVRTTTPTYKWYYFGTSVYSPSIPASSRSLLFSNISSTEASGIVPELCLIPSSSDGIYSRIVFQAVEGSRWNSKTVDVLTFREAFRLNISLTEGVVNLSLTRSGVCYYRTSSTDSYTLVSGTMRKSFLLTGTSNRLTYYFVCNDSFGESASRVWRSTSGVRELVLDIYGGIVAPVGDEFFYVATGERFAWQPWFIMVLVVLGLFVLPTLLVVLLAAKRSAPVRRRNEG